MKLITTLLAFLAIAVGAQANSLAIYKGRIAKTATYKDAELHVPRKTASNETCYCVVSLQGGGGGSLTLVFYGKDKEGKYFYVGTNSVVTAQTLLDDSGKKGQAVVARGTTIGNVGYTTAFNFWADGPINPGLPKAAKTDREWTRTLAYEEDYGVGVFNADQNDYTSFAKGILVLDDNITKAANTAGEGALAGLERIKTLLRGKGYTER